jgi:hypothetical protein
MARKNKTKNITVNAIVSAEKINGRRDVNI